MFERISEKSNMCFKYGFCWWISLSLRTSYGLVFILKREEEVWVYKVVLKKFLTFVYFQDMALNSSCLQNRAIFWRKCIKKWEGMEYKISLAPFWKQGRGEQLCQIWALSIYCNPWNFCKRKIFVLIKFSSLSALTKIEELTAGSDEKTQRSSAGNWTQGLENCSRTL